MRTPTPLKDLINLCWSQDPEKRPTFNMIYQIFSKGKVYFPDTNKEEIIEFLENIDNIEKKTKIRSQTFNNLKKENINKKIRFDLLSDIKSPGFELALNEIYSKLTPEFSDQFFSEIYPHFHPSTSEKIIFLLLNIIDKLIQSNQLYYNSFIKKQFYLKLNFTEKSLSTSLCSIFLYIFSKSPNLVDEQLIITVIGFIQDEPFKVLRLLNIYTCNDIILPYFWRAADPLILNSQDFIISGASKELIQLIFTLCLKYPKFKEERFSNFIPILLNLLENSNLELTQMIYEILCFEESISFLINEEILIKHLLNPNLIDYVLSIILRLEYFITSESLIKSILFISSKSELAYSCILKLCENKLICIYLSKIGSEWILLKLPTFEKTLKILLNLLKFKECQENISQFKEIINIFEEIILTKNINLINLIYPIILNLKINNFLINKFNESNFLKDYYEFCENSNDNKLFSTIFIITEIIAKKGYCKQFINLIPILNKLFENKNLGWEIYIISNLIILSCFNELKNLLIENNFLEKISYIKNDKNLLIYYQLFLQRIS